MCKAKTIQEIIYDIHKRKNEYLFGNSINNAKCSYEKEDCQECSFKLPDDCPYYYREENKVNPLRFVQCYMSNNKGFIEFLDKNDFIVTAPLFRIHKIKNGEIEYLDNYWYPFRNNAFVDIPARTSDIKLSISLNNKHKEDLEKLRWGITTQRNSKEYNNNLGFSIFKKIQETNYDKDKTFKYIDVCDGYATFMMLYFVIVRRREALVKFRNDKENEIKTGYSSNIKIFNNNGQINFITALIKDEYEDKFKKELKWELIETNDRFNEYINDKTENSLSLSIEEKKVGGLNKQIVHRTSTWEDDLKLLGLLDEKNNYTKKLDWFITWLYKDDEFSDKTIVPYKEVLKKIIKKNNKNLELNYKELVKVKIFNKGTKFKFDDKEKKDFTLFPPMHIIVRAFWKMPVRWFFIPMTPVFKENSKKTLSTSGVILMLKDDKETTAYFPQKVEHQIINKVKNLLPLLTAIYSIEKQSLQEHINNERLILHIEQKITAIRSAVAKVFLRTLTHNIGSHVINKISEIQNLDLEPLLELGQKGKHQDAINNEQYRGLYINCKPKTKTIHNEIEEQINT